MQKRKEEEEKEEEEEINNKWITAFFFYSAYLLVYLYFPHKTLSVCIQLFQQGTFSARPYKTKLVYFGLDVNTRGKKRKE